MFEVIYFCIGVVFSTVLLIWKGAEFISEAPSGLEDALEFALVWFMAALLWFPIAFMGLFWLIGRLLLLLTRLRTVKQPLTDEDYERQFEEYWEERLNGGSHG